MTSDGFYENFRSAEPTAPAEAVVADVDAAAGGVVAANPWVKYLDGVGHGYTLVDVTPHRVQADYFHTPRPTSDQPDPRVVDTVTPAYATSWQTTAGSRHITPAAHRVGPRSDEPR